MKEKLLALAVVRKEVVEIGDQKVMVREIGTVEFAHYGKLANGEKDDSGAVTVPPDRNKATAYLISVCVVDENDQPVLTEEEALPLAKIARTATPIANKVMELSGYAKEDTQKHVDAG